MRLERDGRTWLTYGQLGVYGWFLYGFGPVVNLLRQEQGFSRTAAGLHGTALAVGALGSALVVGRLAMRFGRVRMIWAGLVLLSLGIGTLTAFSTLPATLTGALVSSFGGSFVVTCTATVLAARHGSAGPAAITEANAVAAGVGTVAPLAVGAAYVLGSWRPALLVPVVAVVVLAASTRRVHPGPAGRVAAAPAGSGRLSRRYWVSWVVVTAGIGVEFCLTLWAADHLRQRAGLSTAAAAAGVTALVVGMFLGRVGGGWLALRLPVDRLLGGALGLNAAGFAVFWLARSPTLALAGLFASGLGVALYFPLGLARAIEASDGRPDKASARVGLGAALAAGAGPFGLGALADATSLHLAMLVVPALLAVAAAGILLAPVQPSTGPPESTARSAGPASR